jgi:hypothetical protein
MTGYVRVFASAGAAVAWGALIFSLALGLAGPDAAGDVLGRFVSSFTIMTNALAALAFTAVAADPERIDRTQFIGAVAVYLFIVALVYFAEFHGALETTGIGAIPDAAIHDVVPLLFLVFWAAFTPKGRLTWRAPFLWLAFPLAYLAFTLTRGALTGIYSYPFLDAAALGYARVAVNGFVLMAVYLVAGGLLVLADCALSRFSRSATPAGPSAA